MNKIYLFGVMASLLALSAVALANAHNTDSGIYPNDNNHYYNVDEMNEMHNAMVQSINDPALVSEMNEIHESCIQSVKGEEYTAVGGNMMGSYGMMMGGMM